jgi:hypothetical protein
MFGLLERFLLRLSSFLVTVKDIVVTIVQALGEVIAAAFVEMAPLLVPAFPASLVFINLINPETFRFANWQAWIGAGSLEMVGLTSGVSALRAEMHNRRNIAKKNKVPAAVLWGAFVWYIITVLSLVVFTKLPLLYPGQFGSNTVLGPIVILVADASMALLSIPAIVVLGFRIMYREVFEGDGTSRSSTEVPGSSRKFRQVYLRTLLSEYPDVVERMIDAEASYPGARPIIKYMQDTHGISATEKSVSGWIEEIKKTPS